MHPAMAGEGRRDSLAGAARGLSRRCERCEGADEADAVGVAAPAELGDAVERAGGGDGVAPLERVHPDAGFLGGRSVGYHSRTRFREIPDGVAG